MTPYLQRLYDAATGPAPALEARPAQRSSSPLLAVDQRLASPAYAGSFLLGLPGTPDPAAEPPPALDLDAGPRPDPDPRPVPAPGRREPTRDERPVQVPPLPPASPATPRRQVQDRVLRRHGGVADPRPEVAVREPVTQPTPMSFTPEPATQPDPRPVDVRTWLVVDRTPRRERAPQPPVESAQITRVVAPAGPPQPGHLRAAPEVPPRPAAQRHRARDAAAPPLVHPLPKRATEPLPPPPAPRAAEPANLTHEVRRLVREAMAVHDSPRRPSRDQHDGSVTDQATTGSPARTAEAVSVIGPLDRPARASTLFGLRLR